MKKKGNAFKPKKKKKVKRLHGRVHKYAGHAMASKSEVDFAQQCDELKIPWKYEPDKITWMPAPPKLRKYTPDFKITRKDGTHFYVEYKGFLRLEDKKKMAAVKVQHPEIDIRFVFTKADKAIQGATKRKDGTKMSHKEWAIKNNYLWAEGFIPEAWMKE